MTTSGDTTQNFCSAGSIVTRGCRCVAVLTAAILLPPTTATVSAASIMHARHHQHQHQRQHVAVPSAVAALGDIRGGGQHRDVSAVVSSPVRHDEDFFDDGEGGDDSLGDDDEGRCLVGDSMSSASMIHARHHHPLQPQWAWAPSAPASLQVQAPPRGGGARAVARGRATTSQSQSLKRNEFVAELLQRLKIMSYFALWYVLNVVYNIINKKVLNAIPAPLTIGSIQFLVGGLYASTLWVLGLRPNPRLTPSGRSICAWVGLYHMSGQLFSMVSMGAGPISFTHIVKALEPFFSAVVSALVFGKWMKPQVYATLVPVVGGVGYACLKERHFSWLAFSAAMGSNMAFALRAVVSKSAMTTYIGDNLSSTNLFAVVTWFAFFLSVPVALLGEGTSIFSLWSKAVDAAASSSGDATSSAVGGGGELARAILVSGLFHYLNNEVMYLALGNVHPVTLAVGNTMKRVFILVASVLVFRNPVSLQAAIGSAIGISGVLLYSLTRAHYEKLEAEQQAT